MAEEIRTAAELDALPVDSVVLDHAKVPRTKRRADSVMGAGWTHAGRGPISSALLADGFPLTVLFRPDAPQPTPVGDDVVERRVARAILVTMLGPEAEQADESWGPDWIDALVIARAALAAARAGEVERCAREVAEVITERDEYHEWADRLAAALAPADVIGEHSSANSPWQNALDYAAQRGGEAVDREALAWKQAVAAYPTEHVGYDQPVPSTCRCDECYHREGQRNAYVAGFLAARGGTAPSVSAEQVAEAISAHGPVGQSWYRQGGQVRPLRWVTDFLAALGIEVRP